MGALDDAVKDVQSYSCICRPTKALLRVIEGLNVDELQVVIAKLAIQLELAERFGIEADGALGWEALTVDEMEIVDQALEDYRGA